MKMKENRKQDTMVAKNTFLLVVIMALSAGTDVAALVPTITSKAIKNYHPSVISDVNKKRPFHRVNTYIRLAAVVTKDETNLQSSLPAMPAQIRQQASSDAFTKKPSERKGRKRSRKRVVSKNVELLDAIPSLSDILEGRASSDNSCDKDNKESSENKSEIKMIKTESTKANDPTRIGKNKGSEMATSRRINSFEKNNVNDTNLGSRNKQTRSSPTPNPPTQPLLPWRASYKSSKRTQGRIQKVFTESSPLARGIHSRALRVLGTLLDTPPQYCNSVNLVCALTYSAKALGRQRVDHLDKNVHFRKSLQETFDILHDLLVVHRDERLFTPRQLCNVAWAIAKHVDRDPDLLLSQQDKHPAHGAGSDIAVKSISDPSKLRLEETIDEIARQLTEILLEDKNDRSDIETGSEIQSKVSKSSFQKPKIKLGEICMACWAYGKLRHRVIPPGWPGPPQMGAVSNPNSILADWKYEKFGSRRTFGSNVGNEDASNEDVEVNETDELFDAIGYALCGKTDDEKQNNSDSTLPMMLEDCTWSELANVGWAFASHGRCKSTESEALLKAIAQEAATRLKNGTIANNGSQQNFLVRDVTQLVWSLGTLQSDNFRLADDLLLLVEALSLNLRLGVKTRSFVQGRPLRRWSCADLVQTAVALSHARIDERLLLQAIYEEGNFRLMEGASSHQKLSAMKDSPLEKNNSSNDLPLGEGRRMFHPWEASILLWAQARLFLTGQEGAEFDEFTEDAPLFFLKALRENRGSFAKAMIGPQEQANIVWSLVILKKYDTPEAIILIDLIFAEAARSCKENKSMQLEHAHQLWQAYFMLQEDCPDAVKRVPQWFVSYLKEKWLLEKARLKLSSARHQSLSSTLELMGVDHINEHDEDIDVAIILKPNAVWVHETEFGEMEEDNHVSVAVEFDGPNHFTRIRDNTQLPDAPTSSPEPPRALGHTVLKYRILKKLGWTVVRIPYYEFDRIPFWASMERQRYLQRKLKTHANIQFSEVDVSEYKALTPNRNSRFD